MAAKKQVPKVAAANRLKRLVDFNMLSVDMMTNKMEMGRNFTLSRFGDGEFDAMVGTPGVDGGDANCDGHEYFKDMGKALRLAMRDLCWSTDPEYYAGIHFNERIAEKTLDWLLKAVDIQKPFADNSVFHDALFDHSLFPFFNALHGRHVVIVGNLKIRKQKVVDAKDFIVVPEKNSWLERDRIVNDVFQVLEQNSVVLWCAGPPTPVFIQDVRLMYQHQKIGATDTEFTHLMGTPFTQIDFGSTFDYYVKNYIRSFHKRVDA